MRTKNPDLARAVDAGALVLPDPDTPLVRRNGILIRYNPKADLAERAAAIDLELEALAAEMGRGRARAASG